MIAQETGVPCRATHVKELPRDAELLLYVHKDKPGWILNPSAKSIWELCDGRRTVEVISNRLEERLNLPRGALMSDVTDGIADLYEAKLVTLGRPVVERHDDVQIDWRCLAEPQADGSDLDAALAILAARSTPEQNLMLRRRSVDASPTICDARVALRYCYPEKDLEGRLDAPFDHPRIAESVDYLRHWPLGYHQFQLLIHSVHPLLEPGLAVDDTAFLVGSFCHSSQSASMFGTMLSSINCPMMLAENFVHELAHQKLFALGIFKDSALRFITNSPKEGYASPIVTDRPRPMTALVHGVYAYMYVTELDIKVLESARFTNERRQQMLHRLGTNVERLVQGIAEIRRHIRLDADGQHFFEGFYHWVDELIRQGKRSVGKGPNGSLPVRVSVTEPVKVFVGTDPRQKKAEIALEYSIRTKTRGPVEIVWMDYGRGGIWADWQIGRDRGRISATTGPGWPTEFSGYRFAIPEANGFRGRAIYLDVDMVVLGDLRELYEQPMPKPWLMTPSCPATMLIDCGFFKDTGWWPRLEDMRQSAWGLGEYTAILGRHGVLDMLAAKWNCHDEHGYVPGETAVVHYTRRRYQPWRPYPEVFDYAPHPDPELEELWWSIYCAGLREKQPGDKPNGLGRAYSRANPSPRYQKLVELHRNMHVLRGDPSAKASGESIFGGRSVLPHVERIKRLIDRHAARSVLDYGSGKGLQYGPLAGHLGTLPKELWPIIGHSGTKVQTISEYWGIEQVACYDPGYAPFSELPADQFDGVVCTEVLEHCAKEDVGWILRELFSFARKFVFATICNRLAEKCLPNGENAHCTVESIGWWSDRIHETAVHYPGLPYEIRFENVSLQGCNGRIGQTEKGES